jgi:hypothetical protein
MIAALDMHAERQKFYVIVSPQSLLQEGRKTILLKPELAGRSRSLDLLK